RVEPQSLVQERHVIGDGRRGHFDPNCVNDALLHAHSETRLTASVRRGHLRSPSSSGLPTASPTRCGESSSPLLAFSGPADSRGSPTRVDFRFALGLAEAPSGRRPPGPWHVTSLSDVSTSG